VIISFGTWSSDPGEIYWKNFGERGWGPVNRGTVNWGFAVEDFWSFLSLRSYRIDWQLTQYCINSILLRKSAPGRFIREIWKQSKIQNCRIQLSKIWMKCAMTCRDMSRWSVSSHRSPQLRPLEQLCNTPLFRTLQSNVLVPGGPYPRLNIWLHLLYTSTETVRDRGVIVTK
jgi:hypothetical protein